MRRVSWLLLSGWWVTFGLLHFFSLLEFLPFEDIAVRRSLAWAFSGFVVSLPLAFLVPRARGPRGFAGVFLLGSALAALWIAVAWILQEIADPFLSPYGSYLFLAPNQVAKLDSPLAFVGIMLGLLAVLALLETRRRLLEQQQGLARAEQQAQRAHLEALRYQLNPHFLFNALNSIGALAAEDPEKTRQVVTQLGDFLRYSLVPSSADSATRVTLETELEAIRAYLEIEQVRFESDLVVSYDVGPDALGHQVPAFLLLPLVDNAIKYGQRTSPVPLRLNLTGHVDEQGLNIEVANSGHWVEDADVPGTRKGLANVEQRLAAEYPGRHSLQTRSEDGWVHVELHLRDGQA